MHKNQLYCTCMYMKKRICNWNQIIRLFISFPHIIFRMDQLPLYDIKHSKHVTVYLQQWKQLYTPETCLLSITNNKTLGHMTPFMALLPLLDKKIVQTYPDMGAGGNGNYFTFLLLLQLSRILAMFKVEGSTGVHTLHKDNTC